jgi:hypothetical protein
MLTHASGLILGNQLKYILIYIETGYELYIVWESEHAQKQRIVFKKIQNFQPRK